MNHESFIHQEADKCVKCGLCLPHCPTYVKTRNEADSPRGRIALLQGLAEGRLELSPHLEAHLDGCLSCRACEHACPSTVRFGPLLDAGRALVRERKGSAPHTSRQERLVERLRTGRLPLPLLRMYQTTGTQWLARHSGILSRLGLERLDRYLPRLPRQMKWRREYAPRGTTQGNVALFTGCMKPFDQATLHATIRLLTRCGFRVHVPPTQVCCGALDQHGGKLDQACSLAKTNIEAFNSLAVDALIFTASGCGATLSEYQALAGHAFTMPVMDISRFLQQVPWLGDITFATLEKKVAVHAPCTLTHVLHTEDSVYTLLARIPGIELLPLPDNDTCCGAAGNYMLTQAEMADALLEEKMEKLKALQPDILLTSNTGCALHLAAGMREAGLKIEVIHPVVLLERQVIQGKRYKVQGEG